MHGVDTVFLCLTGVDELLVAVKFLDAMQRTGCVEHIVYLSACGDFLSLQVRRAWRRSCARVLLRTSLSRVRSSTRLRTLSLQGRRQSWVRRSFSPNIVALLKDGFPGEPLGKKGVSRVSTANLALAA